MSKRAFKKYIAELPKEALEEQLLDLYQRFGPVKTYYDFAFNPKEEKLLNEAKAKIRNEYFPLKRRRPRARRSVAQKYIRHFRTLGMADTLIADLMLFNLETALDFQERRNVPQAFYKSILNSFREAQEFITYHQIREEIPRLQKVLENVLSRSWPISASFEAAWERQGEPEGFS